MKTIYVLKGDVIPNTGGGRHWIVTDHVTLQKFEVEDDVEAPLGYIWDGDYRSGRPTFRAPD